MLRLSFFWLSILITASLYGCKNETPTFTFKTNKKVFDKIKELSGIKIQAGSSICKYGVGSIIDGTTLNGTLVMSSVDSLGQQKIRYYCSRETDCPSMELEILTDEVIFVGNITGKRVYKLAEAKACVEKLVSGIESKYQANPEYVPTEGSYYE